MHLGICVYTHTNTKTVNERRLNEFERAQEGDINGWFWREEREVGNDIIILRSQKIKEKNKRQN